MSESDIRGTIVPAYRCAHAGYLSPLLHISPLYFVSGQPLSAAVGNALSPGTVAIIL
jgi:hypothetical protein